MGYSYFSELQITHFDRWFAAASDDDRAECVVCWNWGLGGAIETLQSIIERPDCDVTTALIIFWSSEAVNYLAEFPDQEAATAAGEGGIYKLHASIIQRYKNNMYTYSGLDLDLSDHGANLSTVENLAQHRDLAASPEMAVPLKGRLPVRTTEFEMYGVPRFIEHLESLK